VETKGEPRVRGGGSWDIDVAVVGASSRSSTLIILPCRELGGGGAFLPAENPLSPPIRLLSSSRSDISCDVRGDSGCGSCIASNIDCRDMDDVSVLLPPSPKV
jgi:hypothetical protein